MTTHAATSGTTREDTMSTRRTPEEMAQAALDTAQRKVERAQERVIRARSELADAQAARATRPPALGLESSATTPPLTRCSRLPNPMT